jgi:hypothetical protein
LPVASVPLWQPEQDPITALWSKIIAFHVTSMWQRLQSAFVKMWSFDLPLATKPSWQLEQVPVTAAWSKRGLLNLF